MKKGHVLSWKYIHDVTQMGVLEEGKLYRSIAPLVAIDMNSSPTTGTFYFLRTDDISQPFTPTSGPRFEYAWGRAEGPYPDGSTDDLATDAAHIIPYGRLELFAEAWSKDASTITEDDRYHVSCGITLRNDVARDWANGRLAFYPDPVDPTTLIVHVFHKEAALSYHGKKRTQTIFNIKDTSELPDPRLLRIHYKQCVLKYIRGYSFFPTIESLYEHTFALSGRNWPPTDEDEPQGDEPAIYSKMILEKWGRVWPPVKKEGEGGKEKEDDSKTPSAE